MLFTRERHITYIELWRKIRQYCFDKVNSNCIFRQLVSFYNKCDIILSYN